MLNRVKTVDYPSTTVDYPSTTVKSAVGQPATDPPPVSCIPDWQPFPLVSCTVYQAWQAYLWTEHKLTEP